MSRKANNDYLTREKAKMELQQAQIVQLELQRTTDLVFSVCRDCAMIACNVAFGISKGRMKKFLDAYGEAFDWWMKMYETDTIENHDMNFGWAKSKMDAKIKELVPDDMYQKFEDRYNFAEDSIGRNSI